MTRPTVFGASDFNPRIPLGMRPQKEAVKQKHQSDFNPRIPLGMRQRYALGFDADADISIHASH